MSGLQLYLWLYAGELNVHDKYTLHSGHNSSPSLAKTMAVFKVRGLFTSLQFPYVHFACTNLCGDQMYDPLWEAIWRIENCGLKVIIYVCLHFMWMIKVSFMYRYWE